MKADWQTSEWFTQYCYEHVRLLLLNLLDFHSIHFIRRLQFVKDNCKQEVKGNIVKVLHIPCKPF